MRFVNPAARAHQEVFNDVVGRRESGVPDPELPERTRAEFCNRVGHAGLSQDVEFVDGVELGSVASSCGPKSDSQAGVRQAVSPFPTLLTLE